MNTKLHAAQKALQNAMILLDEALAEETKTTFDFQDGNGPVPAHKHSNGGGWVADTATVEATAFVGMDAWVFDDACVYGNALVFGDARVYGNARVFRHEKRI